MEKQNSCINEQGNKYGRLLVVSKAATFKQGNKTLARWNCSCDCGIMCVVFGTDLRTGHVKSCGCLKKQMAIENCKKHSDSVIGSVAENSVNEVGNRYGRLEIVEALPTKHKKSRWLCKCDCGKFKNATGDSLRQGKVKSCGCLRKEADYSYTSTSNTVKYTQYKSNAKRRNLEFLIPFNEFEKLVSSSCIYCNGNGGGIDRWNNEIGYTLENSVPCCTICNRMKLTWTPLQFLSHCKKVIENHKNNNNA